MTCRAVPIAPVAILVALCAGLCGCTMAPAYKRPPAPVAAHFPQGDAYAEAAPAAVPALAYAAVFHDARLQKIVGQALANNRDLRVAAADIAAARAQYHIDRAELLPEIDASAGATRSGGGSALATLPETGTGTGTGGSTVGNTVGGGRADRRYSANVGVNAFEIDLFGRLRSQSDAALNQYFATEAGADATRLTLIGDVATAWLTYAADRSLLQIAQDTAVSAQKSVELTRARLQGGAAPRTDLRQAQTILAQAQSDVAQSRATLAQDVNALRLLAGSEIDPALLPQSIAVVADSLEEIPAGVDSAVLLRRPDVAEAEYQLRAANADIGAARAALFPRISLTALAGFASSALGSLFDGGSFSWSVSPQASYPIFRAGAGRAGVDQARAQHDAAIAAYEKAVQTAFREVADALARRGTITDQETADRALVAAAQDNYQLSNARYQAGVDTFLQTLDAQRSLYTAQRSLVATQLTRAANLVTLYRVLGGDAQTKVTDAGPPHAARADASD